MAKSKNPFAKAHYDKVKLTKQTSKRVERIYRQSADEIKKKTKLIKGTKNEVLQKIYLDNLLRDINKSHDEMKKILESIVLDAGEKAGTIAVDAGNKAMKLSGLSLKGAYSYVPKQQVELLASGKLYGEKWSLSKAIWKNNLRTKSDVQNMVAKGLAQNKPIKDIADDLVKYIDPAARKPWDWNKVYPGTSEKVDYSAQRLARTMIQHSYQTSLVQSQLYNPFCKGIIWYSVGIHGRTCGLCLDRDGQIFPVKDLPLDHPNGLCYFEPALDDMTDIADRMADWLNGNPDAEIDDYVTKGLGLDISTGKSITAVDAFSEQFWMEQVMKNTVEEMLDSEDVLQNLPKEQLDALIYYTGSGFEPINDILRDLSLTGYSEREVERAEQAIENIRKAFENLKIDRDVLYARRGSSFSDLASLMPGDYEKNKMWLRKTLQKWDKNYTTVEEALEAVNNKVSGGIGSFTGCTSTSSIWERGFRGRVEYVFKIPKGAKGSSIMTISKYGTGEGEFLLGPDTRVRIVKVAKSDGHMLSDFRVFLEVLV